MSVSSHKIYFTVRGDVYFSCTMVNRVTDTGCSSLWEISRGSLQPFVLEAKRYI